MAQRTAAAIRWQIIKTLLFCITASVAVGYVTATMLLLSVIGIASIN